MTKVELVRRIQRLTNRGQMLAGKPLLKTTDLRSFPKSELLAWHDRLAAGVPS